ncbi:MAG TPA: hydratase [Bradyrhizobium sp.]|uniref:2-keto-4-pentenoate hydratase n=1 Tax=Bradyrhizobium sp. TaxID=376 RepID=UPI002B46DFA7|nr:hydratase [Bradyrhizobium sp.]HKO72125.1 hydratase [Bradyrhizobium sp.]
MDTVSILLVVWCWHHLGMSEWERRQYMIYPATKLESTGRLDDIGAEAFSAIRAARQISPFSSRPGGLAVDQAYRVTPLVKRMYEASGSNAVGRKIGFTNRTIWAQYGVYAPIWGYLFERTVYDLAAIATLPLYGFAEPRIEPEIVFGLSAAPSAEMDESALSSCIQWVALGFEIVQSIFPGWKFSAADTIAANGLHGALLIGPRHPFAPKAAEWQRTLSVFEIDLSCDGRLVDHGQAGNVLDGPLSALGHLVQLLADDPLNPQLAAGEIVSTGTLTKAMPIIPGQTWSAKPAGIALDEIQIGFV